MLDSAPDVLDFYRENEKCFKVATVADLPKGLKWENGSELAEFASPEAKRGGTFQFFFFSRLWILHHLSKKKCFC